jgi:hypothetical protein
MRRVLLRRSALVSVGMLALAVAPRTGAAQATPAIPKSQLATVTQNVGPARIEILYRRPVARGRTLFGALVPYGRMWTPSADSAARFTVSAPVTVNGSALPAGSYAIWAIPDSASWTLVFSSVASVFHLRYPEGRDVLRVQAAPVASDHAESLLFDFPLVDADSAVMQIRWGKTAVPVMIRAPRAP